MELSLDELLPHIYTQPDQPDLTPYVTSYYKDNWGFCMSENDKKELKEGKYHIVIDAEKKPGQLELADLIIPGESSKEIFFSTYIKISHMFVNTDLLVRLHLKSGFLNSRSLKKTALRFLS